MVASEGEGPRKISDPNELLYRNAHPNLCPDGVPSSQVFTPNTNDGGHMSVAQGSRVTPEEHFVEYTGRLERESVGVWAISVADVEAVDLEAFDDDGLTAGQPKGHGYVDFSRFGPSAQDSRGRKLKRRAVARRRLYPTGD